MASVVPASAQPDLTQSYEMGREGWRIRIETRTSMHATASDFVLRGSVRAYENGALAGSRDCEGGQRCGPYWRRSQNNQRFSEGARPIHITAGSTPIAAIRIAVS
jgi:hypothetical protein